MEFRLLGPLEVRAGERVLALGGAKQRAVLALLLLHANEVVSSDRLIDELWGERPPKTAQTTLQVYVSRLRKTLPEDVLRTREPGYVVEVEPEQLDLRRFEALLHEGRQALAEGAPELAAHRLAEALGLWRGPPLADFAFASFAQPAIARLEELRLACLEERIEADLALGRHPELVGELEALIDEHPLRERLHWQRMLALYRSGRQAEALAAYQQARRLLVEELGIEPSPALQRLEKQILSQEEALEWRPSSRPARGATNLPLPTTPPTMPVQPETRYARSGDVSIAYQVVGEGPFDLVFIPPFVTHVELVWTVPSFAPFLNSIASFSRLIRFDKRGTGMSDRVTSAPTLETRMDDVRAVMDAADSSRAALFGSSEGGSMSLLFAATYPERTAALILRSAFPRTMWAHDYPWGRTEEQYRSEIEREMRLFGPRDQAEEAVRSLMRFDDDDQVPVFVDYLRRSASPGAVKALALMNKEIDVRHVLPAIHVPTLILRGAEDTVVPLDVARYLADRIEGARLVEVPGGHLAIGRAAAAILSEIQRFLAEAWETGSWEEAEPERVLATVLFTDIVGASERAAELGDRAWRGLLERHHALVRRQLARFRGSEVDTAGDGFFASFDGPARAIRCACAIVDAVRDVGVEVRAGLHTGECELVEGKVAGIAVHTGARVASQAQPGEVLVSSTVKDLVAGSGLRFEDCGAHELEGIPGEWRLFAVERGSAG